MLVRIFIRFTCLMAVAMILGGRQSSAIEVNTGIDTFLSAKVGDRANGIGDGTGCCGGFETAAGAPISGNNGLEVDNNQNPFGPVEPLIYFDLSVEPDTGLGTILDRFLATPGATATLEVNIGNGFDPLPLYRVTVDWISAPLGNDVNRNNFPGAAPAADIGTPSAFTPGVNVEATSNMMFADQVTGVQTLDATIDVTAWANGQANYGWAGIPTGTQGGAINSFEAPPDPFDPSILNVPILRLLGPGGTELLPAGVTPTPTPISAVTTGGLIVMSLLLLAASSALITRRFRGFMSA